MNPLDQLKDIHLPEQVSAWPPAYGWWILLVLSLLAVFLLVRWWRNYRFFMQAKRDTKALLSQLDNSQPDWPAQLNELLKRLCISYFPPEHVASQYGQQWLQFLAAQIPEKKREQFIETMTPWQHSLYQANAEQVDFEQIKSSAMSWLNNFKPSRSAKAGLEVKREVKREVKHV